MGILDFLFSNKRNSKSINAYQVQLQQQIDDSKKSKELCDAFLQYEWSAEAEKNIEAKIALFQKSVEAFQKAKDWHYNHSAKMKDRFIALWEHCSNTKNPDFSFGERTKEKLALQLRIRDIIIPWIKENAIDGFIQNKIYTVFPNDNKAILRKAIDGLVEKQEIRKEQKGKSYYIFVGDDIYENKT